MKNIFFVLALFAGCSTRSSIYQPHLAAEGDFVMVGNSSFAKYIEKDLSLSDLNEIQAKLKDSLTIAINNQGFVQAANRNIQNKSDSTNYDAIWVRDSIWVYFSFVEQEEYQKAREIILNMWKYYSTEDQLRRFENIIAHPNLASEGGMNVPHIRFNGKSEKLADVMNKGRPEEWNHRQNDAHGLFLLGLSIGFEKGFIKSADITANYQKSFDLFIPYFKAIKYWDFEDAGAWEEISKINTSSISMVVRSLEHWEDLLAKRTDLKSMKWNHALVKKLINKGYDRIRTNLKMGGESPDHDPLTSAYRREDAALFNLFLPFPLKRLTEDEKLLGLTILEKLIRPYGVIRYPLDSYQSGNYWIKEKNLEGQPELTGDSSSSDSFRTRFKQFIPGTEAQWFFDSKLSMIYLQFKSKDKKYMRRSLLHFKRALGQITPEHGQVLAADNNPVMNLAVPESVNTIVKDGIRTYVPSPITPLNWAKASLSMAIIRLKKELR